MLTIITNYKNIFFSFTKNMFSEAMGNDGSGEKGTYEKNGTKMDDLMSAILDDKTINGDDKEFLEDLIKEYETEKNGIYKNTAVEVKKTINDISTEILNNGYSINNLKDYLVLKNILEKFDGKTKIPEYNTFSKYIHGFVIEKNSNGKLKVYGMGKNDSDMNMVGYIEKGKFITKTYFGSSFDNDYGYQNNQILDDKISSKYIYKEANDDEDKIRDTKINEIEVNKTNITTTANNKIRDTKINEIEVNKTNITTTANNKIKNVKINKKTSHDEVVSKQNSIKELIKNYSNLTFENGKVYLKLQTPNGEIHRGFFTPELNPDIKDNLSLQKWIKQITTKLNKKYSKIKEQNKKIQSNIEINNSNKKDNKTILKNKLEKKSSKESVNPNIHLKKYYENINKTDFNKIKSGEQTEQIKVLSKLNLNLDNIKEQDDGSYLLDIDGKNDLIISKDSLNIKDEEGLINISFNKEITTTEVIQIVELMKTINEKTKEIYDSSKGMIVSDEGLLIKKYLEKRKPIDAIEKLETINHTDLMKDYIEFKDTTKVNTIKNLKENGILKSKQLNIDGKTYELGFDYEDGKLKTNTEYFDGVSDAEVDITGKTLGEIKQIKEILIKEYKKELKKEEDIKKANNEEKNKKRDVWNDALDSEDDY